VTALNRNAENAALRRLIVELWGDLDDERQDWYRGAQKRRDDPDLDLLIAVVEGPDGPGETT
jgi:hypothetical protein